VGDVSYCANVYMCVNILHMCVHNIMINPHVIQGGPKKLSYRCLSTSSLNIDQFSQFFSPVDSVRNLPLIGMHTTPTMSLHYLVKHIYPKTNNIIHSLVVTSSVMGQFQEIPLLESMLINC